MIMLHITFYYSHTNSWICHWNDDVQI
jgi:hypothetical protein